MSVGLADQLPQNHQWLAPCSQPGTSDRSRLESLVTDTTTSLSTSELATLEQQSSHVDLRKINNDIGSVVKLSMTSDEVSRVLGNLTLGEKYTVLFIIRTVVRIVGMGRMSHIYNTKCSHYKVPAADT